MGTTRKCTTVDDEATRNLTVSLREALPPNHLARFVAEVIAPLDVSSLSVRYGTRGGEPFAPEMLLGLLFYGDATGVCSARRIENQPPQPGPRDKKQDTCTDPESRLMKNSTHDGVDHHDHAQGATDHDRVLLVASSLSNHANDQAEVVPTLDTLPEALGTPPAGALDTGSFSAANIAALAQRGIAPYIAVGRHAHHHHWSVYGAQPPAPLPDDASPLVTMAATRRTEIGQAISRLRTCTVEPVCGIIKAVLGFRQGSLRGLAAAAGAWCLVCRAFNRKRLQVLCADCAMLPLA